MSIRLKVVPTEGNQRGISPENTQNLSRVQIGKILAVAAGKGGVGKSAVAVNLALALAKMNLKVGLMDADIYGPSVAQMLPCQDEPTEDPQDPRRLIPGSCGSISLISPAHFQNGAALVRAPIANQVIDQFLEGVNWGKLDVLIIDFPPGTGDIQISLMQKGKIDAALLVTTPQKVAGLDVAKAAQSFISMSIPILGIVENMSYLLVGEKGEKVRPFGEGMGKVLCKELEVPFLGCLPLDPSICAAADSSISLFDLDPKGLGACEFKNLSKKVWDRLVQIEDSNWRVERVGPLQVALIFEEMKLVLDGRMIQKHCPCARCESKEKLEAEEEVAILEFSPKGRYAVSFTFSYGCSRGIYPIALLKGLAN